MACPRRNAHRLTEPYVTTRAKGTGLGLAIVKKIMEEHGGNLILDDRPGGGASVRLIFVNRVGCDRSRSPRRALERGYSRLMARDILIVDDEADIRLLISGILQGRGLPDARSGQ